MNESTGRRSVLAVFLLPDQSMAEFASAEAEPSLVRGDPIDPLGADDSLLRDHLVEMARRAGCAGAADLAVICVPGAADRAAGERLRIAASPLGRRVTTVDAAVAWADGVDDEEAVAAHLGVWSGACRPASFDAEGALAPPPLDGGFPGSIDHLCRCVIERAVVGTTRPGEDPSPYAKALLEAVSVSSVGQLRWWRESSLASDRVRLAAWLDEVAPRIPDARVVADRFLDEAFEAVRVVAGDRPSRIVVGGEIAAAGELWEEAIEAAVARRWPDCGVSIVGAADPRAGTALRTGALRRAGVAPAPSPAPYPMTSAVMDQRGFAVSPTEQINPKTSGIDQMDSRGIVDAILREDEAILPALRAAAGEIGAAIDRVEAAFRAGGRLFYVGAGTSGRLGVLDASEIPPTFRAERWRAQGIIAGGLRALYRSSEGAEDEIDAGGRAVAERGVDGDDVVCGIAASGTTPYVLSALEEAQRRGAGRLLVTCNPAAADLLRPFADVLIVLDTGPEVLSGSTRMKAGTATKQALNMITTGAMIRFGKAYGNLMVDLKAASIKLHDRARRIIEAATGATGVDAERALEEAGWHVKTAVVMLKAGVDADEARRRLDAAGGRAGDALGDAG